MRSFLLRRGANGEREQNEREAETAHLDMVFGDRSYHYVLGLLLHLVSLLAGIQESIRGSFRVFIYLKTHAVDFGLGGELACFLLPTGLGRLDVS